MALTDRRQVAPRALAVLERRSDGTRFDIALSFAGEDREIARVIADLARTNGLKVFLDEHHLWESWGKDLTEFLGAIYDGGARYCVMLISQDYCRKAYTVAERRFALSRALELEREYVLPILLDDSWPEGLPRTTAFLDLRVHSVATVAEALVKKVLGHDRGLAAAQKETPHLERVELAPSDQAAPRSAHTARSPIQFAAVHVAEECEVWKEGGSSDGPFRWLFHGGFGYYADPIFDVTIVNRSPESRLINRIGIQVRGASFSRYADLGGGGAEPIERDRIYQLPLPDVWLALAEAHRASGSDRDTPVDLAESAMLRLPDPVLVQPSNAYRFGLHLFDYTEYFPTNVQLAFCVTTDVGDAMSDLASLDYLIGSWIPPVQRYERMVRGDEEARRQANDALASSTSAWLDGGAERHRSIEQEAFRLWDHAGRPDGSADEFWFRAEEKLSREALANDALGGTHVRTL